MRVRAIAPGYHNLLRRKVGDVFDLKPIKGKKVKPVVDESGKKRLSNVLEDHLFTEEEQFSSKWMEKVEDEEHEEELEEGLDGEEPKPKAKKKKHKAAASKPEAEAEDVL
jgi:hypothetical protein